MPGAARCRFCAAEILICEIANTPDKLLALELVPSPGGEYRVVGNTCMKLPRSVSSGVALRQNHRDVCPRANEAAAYYAQLRADRRQHAARRVLASLDGKRTLTWKKLS